MGKKLVWPIVVAVLIIILAVLYFLLPNSDSFSAKDQSGDISDSLVSDLGQKSSAEGISLLADNLISANSIKETKTYQALLGKYGILPERLLANKSMLEDLQGQGVAIPTVPKFDFQLSFTSDLSSAITDQVAEAANAGRLPIYAFQTSFDDNFYKNLAAGFGIGEDKINTTKDNSTGYQLITDFTAGSKDTTNQVLKMISFNPASGSFVFTQSPGSVAQAQVADVKTTAQNFLFNNQSLKPYVLNLDQKETTTYQYKDTPGVTFVSMHRGWSPLPILNSFGVGAIEKISKTLSATISNAASGSLSSADANIISTSDKLNGFAREDDFNTITVGVDNTTGQVISAAFDLRPLANDAASQKIISAKDALAKAQSGEIYQPIIVPQGDGQFDPGVAYPDNLASSKDAKVENVYLAYIEQPLAKQQSFLQPVYIFKGSATLATGYKTQFSFVTPATDTSQKISLTDLIAVQADEQSQPANNSLQIGYEKIAPTKTEQVSAPPQSDPPSSDKCVQLQPKCSPDLTKLGYNKTEDFKTAFEIDGVLYGVFRNSITKDGAWEYHVFALYPEGIPLDTNLSALRQKFVQKAQESVAAKGSLLARLADPSQAKSMGIVWSPAMHGAVASCYYQCKLFQIQKISGVSPLIYLYSNQPSQFSVRPVSSTGAISYAYPARLNGLWDVVADQSGNLSYQGGSYGKLYYEFTHGKINVPEAGYIVPKDNAKDFLQNTLLPKLNLNAKEISDYLVDIQAHVFNQTKDTTNYYKISLLPQDEINRLLPLEATPNPDLQIRNLLDFEELKVQPNNKVTAPILPQTINRSSYNSVLVENGALLGDEGLIR